MGRHNINKADVSKKKKRKEKKRNEKRKMWTSTKFNRKTKKSSIFQEASFDSSDENDSSNNVTETINKSKSLAYQPHKSAISKESVLELHLTPSRSERESDENVLSDSEEDIRCSLVEDSFEFSSTGHDSYSYDNVIDEFIGEDIDGNKTKIMPSSVDKIKTNICVDAEVIVETSINHLSASSASHKTANKSKTKNNLLNGTENGSFCSSSSVSKENVIKKTHYTNDGIVIVLDKNEIIFFHGLMVLSVLHGEIEILGYRITKNSEDVKVYSPRGTSLLNLKNVSKSDVPVTNYLLNLKVLNKVALSESCAIVLCKKLVDAKILFIEKHMSQQILPRNDNSNLPRVVFEPSGSWNLLKENQDWDNIISNITESTKMMICGGKGVGKTTFLRYAINKLLMRFKEVRIIDLDPGQSEFTIPGCISIVKIDKPIFGVNYTHLKTAERSILSNINIGYEPEKYIAGVKCLLDTTLDEIPTLINYMGYTHGIGINILSAVIIYVQPSDILQINSQNIKKNYKSKLDVNTVMKSSKLFSPFIPMGLDYNLHEMESMCDENDGWTAEPRQLREMSILSYISQMTDSNSVFKTKLPMYKINLSEINISDLKGEAVHHAAVNACLVGLCSLIEGSTSIFQCYGWGIVRGIDIASNSLLLLTPEEPSTLEKASYLVLNSASLPPSIYMTPDEVVGQMPYVIEGMLMSFGQIPKRSRISVKS